MSKETPLPAVILLDEWTQEIDGHAFIFQIKMVSDDPDWYPVSFWKKEKPHISVGSKFEYRPDRKQVEEKFTKSIDAYFRDWLNK